MSDLSPQLREVAESLLRDKKVDLVIGYERGSLPLRTSPCFIRSPNDVPRLIWNASCENNLAVYLRNRSERVAVVAKGCDARSIVGEIVERQLARDKVLILAVPCWGIVDRRRIEAYLEGKEASEATLEGEEVILRGEGFEERLPQQDYLCASCLACEHRTAPIYDALIGDPSLTTESEHLFQEVHLLEAQSPDQRWAYFAGEFGRCIRCYACREACPLCYCDECFVDQTQPAWFGKTDDFSDILIFHIVRALHTAGRCVDCGACSRACPMGIDLRALNRKLIKDVKEWYGYEAGLALDAIPPLSTFRPDDPQEFIK